MSRQYSQAFIDWIVEQSQKDKTFFTKARKKTKDLAKAKSKISRRQK